MYYHMKILIFIENIVLNSDLSIKGKAKEKITTWIEGGAEVEFLTGIKGFIELKKLDDALKELGMSNPKVHAC